MSDNANQELEEIPQPTTLPFIGNLLDVDPYYSYGWQERLALLYGGIYSLSFGGPRRIFVNSFELADECLNEKRFSKKISEVLMQTRNAINDGLFTAHPGEVGWGVAHRILIPAFGPLTIRGMFDDMHDLASQLTLKLARAGPEYVMDAADDFTRLTLDTIALCSMDFRFNSFYKDKQHPFIYAMANFLGENGARSMRPGVVAPFYRAKNKKYFEDIDVMRSTSDAIVKQRRQNPSDRKDLLNAMLNGVDPQTGGKLDDAMITNNLITFMIAGHETTSGTLSFAFYELLAHPEAYQKAQNEVDELIGKGPITVDHLSKLKYLNAVLRETLRLHSPLTNLPVTPLEDTIIGGKYAIKKDETVMVVLHRLHRDPKIWGEDALEWNPDRMTDEKFNAYPKNAWKPFGNGARACIGRPFAWQEALLVLAMLLQNFNFQMDDPSYVLGIKQTGTIKPKDFYMRASLRHGYTATELEQSLRGNIAASASEKPSVTQDAKAVVSGTGRKMNLFFGSNTGTSEAFAARLASSASTHGFQTTVQSLDSAKENLQKDVLNVIMASSFEGEPSDNARHFVAWLQGLKAEDQPLKDVPFVVFGCGHSDWSATYQKIPKLCDTKIEECGGKRIAARGEANAANGDMFSEFEAWEDDVFWPSIGKNYAPTESDLDKTTDTGVHVEISNTRASLRSDVSEAKVISKKLLTGEGSTSKKMAVEITLPSGQGYRAGDYLAVLPVSHESNVTRAMKYFGLSWDSSLQISGAPSSILPDGLSISAHDLFSGYIELTQPATKRNLATLIVAATSAETKQALQDILDHSFTKDIVETRTSVLDLLERHPDIQLPLGQFLAMVPPMRVRQYSISSSPLANPDTCTVTFSVLDAPALSGQGIYHGTASNYLANLEPGDILHVAVKPSSAAFHLPLDIESTPILMIGAGTGVAPFRGFIQERFTQIQAGRKLAPAVLFYGCRASYEDDLHAAELAEWERAGAVKIYKTYSHHPESSDGCKYVQDRLWKEREQARKLFKSGAKLYLCGSGALGNAVNKTFGDIRAEGLKSQGTDVSEEDNKNWLEQIRHERYAVDVYD